MHSLGVENGIRFARAVENFIAECNQHGCTATATSHFSGIQHTDDSDLLDRIHVQVVGQEVGTEVPAFRKYKKCVEGYNSSGPKCEAKLRQRLAAASKP